MKPHDPFQPFDAEAEFAAEDASSLTSEFWRGDRQWVSKSKTSGAGRADRSMRRSRSADAAPLAETPVTGTIRAIRSGFAAFRPRTVEGAARTDRTREHGIVRPDQAGPTADRSTSARNAVPLATREVSIAELAGEWLDEPMPHRPTNRAARSVNTGQRQRPIREEMADARRTTRLPAVVAAPVATRPPARNDFGPNDAEPDDYDAYHYDSVDVALSPVEALSSRLGLGAVDPLLVRVGAMVLVALMLVPLALSMRSGEAPAQALGESLPAPAVVTTETTQPLPSVNPVVATGAAELNATAALEPAPTVAGTPAPAVTQPQQVAPEATRTTAAATISPSTTDDETADDSDGLNEPAVVEEQAQRIPCGDNYQVVANDSWYRIAGAADVAVQDLLDVNMATTKSVLLVGSEVCLPQGASIAAPTTTAAPAPTTTQAPTTTAAPTTTTVPIARATTAQVQQMIRDTFPDDQEEKALEVAFRESRFIATADNGTCCVGVFQLHWTAHRSWLDDYGITTREGLKDAAKNIAAAYALYQSSGWGPWGG
ncbi:MAG TPA: LysM peptidoglycan-binding domain-containing protein [Ilumatobacter sp.]|nr:LysM peptidoglycan-binding domain-containing protein [Ilumatobacter sp.]